MPGRVWIDIENPPQVQYLLPFVGAFRRAGADVVVTARDYGITYELLEQAEVAFHRIGESYGAGSVRKLVGLLGRTRSLSAFVARHRPQAVVHAGRAAALAARRRGIASFAIWDYEHADIRFDRIGRSTIVHPDVIPAEAFERRGIDAGRLLPFQGLKEDLSFAEVDLDAAPMHPLAGGGPHVLVRPPSEEAHYFTEESRWLTLELIAHLARQDAAVVFAPRAPRQASYLDGLAWRRSPVLLTEAVPFVSLLKSVDAVVSSGGTMVREAAYLGVPAYSIFRGESGAVDAHLAETGRLRFLRSREDFSQLALEARGPLSPLRARPADVLERLAAAIVERARLNG